MDQSHVSGARLCAETSTRSWGRQAMAMAQRMTRICCRAWSCAHLAPPKASARSLRHQSSSAPPDLGDGSLRLLSTDTEVYCEMKSRLVDLLPELSVSDADRDMLRDLASTLVAHNVEQCNMLLVTKHGYPDSATGQWKEMRRKDGLRIYRERPSSAQGVAPFTPSLLLLGTVDGSVEDVMYGVVAPTDAALKIKSSCVNDGMLDTKMLCELEEPSMEDPFHHVGIKWKLYHGRDYVSLDATGVVHSSKGERIGYNLAHSVAFSELPEFKSQGVLRGNMSVCSLYKQKTPTTVECYVRGFFDFPTKNEMLNNVALQALASQWLSFGRKVECGRMKKLAWKLRRNSLDGRRSDASSSSSSTCSSSSFGSPPNAKVSPSSSIRPGACTMCLNSFGFLGTSRETCRICMQLMCTRCTLKKIVCVMAPDGRTVLEKKRPLCRGCVEDILKSNTLAIAREELTFDQENGSGSDFDRIPELNLCEAARGLRIPERAKPY